ncbi:MAG: VOC family protein [Flavobacteriales bacterium]
MKKVISGIQQIGIGTCDTKEAFKWYRTHFGMDIRIFEEHAEANLMRDYTGGKARQRHAILALNMLGGGGFEIWQFTAREPAGSKFKIQLGDYGIFAAKIKCRDIETTYDLLRSRDVQVISDIKTSPAGNRHFFAKDPFGNIFNFIGFNNWFKKSGGLIGGVAGCIIGISDAEKAMRFYGRILGYDQVISDETSVFTDLRSIPGGDQPMRRILLRHSMPRLGGFSKFFGPSEIELIQVKERKAKSIYDDRYWGDPGFIHLCFDVSGMSAIEKECRELGFQFTVDSANSFDMGDAAGRFSYVEDPDGTLIEFVETHKVPIIKKLGWYMNLARRNPEKALPNWMVRSLSFNRVRK